MDYRVRVRVRVRILEFKLVLILWLRLECVPGLESIGVGYDLC